MTHVVQNDFTKAPTKSALSTIFDVDKIRQDFPILQEKVHGKPLVYLDNAATSQKPQSVISGLQHYYTAQNSNIHRGVYKLSQIASEAYENARRKVKNFLNANRQKKLFLCVAQPKALI